MRRLRKNSYKIVLNISETFPRWKTNVFVHMQTPFEILAILKTTLHHRIRGQTEVLNRILAALARRELNAVPQTGARGSFFFAGPTGVGKTETAKIIGEVLAGDSGFLRIDCSEFKTLTSFERLLGDRSGDRGRLGQAYDRSPCGVWLWDEIEKAHPELVQLFLQMTSAARVTLACGDTLDLRGIYIIVTSNLGSAEILGRENLTFTSLERHVVRCIEKFLRPELLARFGRPYVFQPLDRAVQAEIVTQHVEDLMGWQFEQGRRIEFHPGVIPFLIHRGFSAKYGARDLDAFIKESIGNAITEKEQDGRKVSGRLVVKNERLELIP